MKKIYFLIFSLVLMLYFEACASNQLESGTGSIKNNQQADKKLRFDDWKYMGFGYQLPQWFQAALDMRISKVKKTDPLLQSSDIKIFLGKGLNPDQADSAAREAYAKALESGLEGYKLYDNFWARETDEVEFPYKSVYIYYKENQ